MKRRYHISGKFRRYRQIGTIITKYGFGIVLEKTNLFKPLKIPRDKGTGEQALSPPVRIRKMLEELGPTFIKMGQILSTRPDLIPIPYIQELEKLQDNTTPVPFEEIARIFKEETGGDISEVFEEFDKKPIASASISQVHRAKLKSCGCVAVKVQKPGIINQIDMDIQILYDLAEVMEKLIKEASMYEPVRIVKEFEKSVKKELDFSVEARNIEIFRKNFLNDKDIYIPFICKEFTSRKVIVLEFINGMKINNVEAIERCGIDKKELSELFMNSIMAQIFNHGFFHADPHPANVFATPDGKICYLDFGIVGRLREERKIHLIFLMQGIAKGDSAKIVDALEMMGSINEEVDLNRFKHDIDDVLMAYTDIPVKDIQINEVIESFFEIMRTYSIKVPADLSLLTKCILTAEGVGMTLNPSLNTTSVLREYLKSFIRQKLTIINIMKELKTGIEHFYYIMKESPGSVESFTKMLKKGYINLAFEHKGLHDLTSTIAKASNRISVSLIISALLVASSLVMVAGMGPYIFGFPALGVVGFLFASILGLWLIWGIIRNREL